MKQICLLYFFYTMNTEEKSKQILDLYAHICRFNYFKDLDAFHHPLTANQELDQLPRTKSQQIQSVPLHFVNSQAYVQFWKPLFFEELKGFVTSSRASESTEPQKFELKSYFDLGQFKIMQFQKNRETAVTYNAGCLMLLSPNKLLPEDHAYPHLVGVSHKFDGNLHIRVILYQNSEHWETFTTTKEWYIQSLCPINSIERQYKALLRFDQVKPGLKQIILKPHQNRLNSSKMFNIPHELNNKLKKTYNQSQYEAISSSLKQQGITLVQGPPGTGKTKTVLGTLSVLLQSSISRQEDQEIPLLLRWKTSQKLLENNTELNPWMKPGFQDWRDQPIIQHQDQPLFLTKFYPTAKRQITLLSRKEEITAPSKVLVCGPSNASVDEVIRKLLKQKLLDGKGKNYLPSFVRVGQNYHESLADHSLDAMATKQQKSDKSDLQSIKKKILKDCRLVFTTLSSSGSGLLQNAEIIFDTVVIDEGGQAVQISSLIPLMYGCKRLILIGDPKQLPATVFSPICLLNHYDQSLFQRLMKSQYPVSMLKIQYRMHPDISRVIGHSFYNGLLTDGNQMHSQPKTVPKAFFMLHVDSSSQIFAEQSYYNPVEADCVKILVNWLSKNYNDIGVLSPYSAQVKWLNQQKLGNKCEVKTIDSFQGREKSVIIFSAVRAQRAGHDKNQNRKKTIGFVGDGRRLNVALSRAKDICIVVGDLQRLQMSKIWKSIIQDAQKRGQAFKIICAEELRQAGDGLNNLRKF